MCSCEEMLIMKLNRWTRVLLGAGIVSYSSVLMAEEATNQVLTAVSSTTLSGYVDTSAIWKFGTGNALLPGRSNDGSNKQDGFNLDAIKLSLSKPMSEANWGAGYQVDFLYGPDAYLYSNSWFDSTTDFAIKQAFVSLRVPLGRGLKVQMGVFDTCVGYEVFDSGSNPNFSRSYGYYIEPLSHTGVLTSYSWTDWLDTSFGVANSYSSIINARPGHLNLSGYAPASEAEKTLLGLITLKAPESFGGFKGTTLNFGVVSGLPAYDPATGAGGAAQDIVNLYGGLNVPTPLKGFTFGAAYDYRFSNGSDITPPTDLDAKHASAAGFYTIYELTPKVTLANRVEYATGSGGTWGTALPKEEFFGDAFTVDYKLWQNVTTRAELRWDRELTGAGNVFGGSATRDPDRDAVSLAFNVIYKF